MSERDEKLPKHEAAPLNETGVSYLAPLPEGVYSLRTPEDRGWAEFREQCRRQMQRPLELRIKYGFCRRIKSTPDQMHRRAFKTMADYLERFRQEYERLHALLVRPAAEVALDRSKLKS